MQMQRRAQRVSQASGSRADVLVLEIPIAKLDLRIEIEDLLSLTESPANGKRGVYPWETG